MMFKCDGFIVMLNNQAWSVKIINLRDSRLSTPNGDFYGICNFDTYEILVGELENKQKMRLTYIHEVVHAILFSHMLEKKKHYTEEEISELVAKYFYTITHAVNFWDINIGGEDVIK